MSEGNYPTGTATRRSTGEIESAFAEMLVGTEELSEQDSSEEELPSTDSLVEEHEVEEVDAELADDSVVDEQDVEEPEDELSEDDEPIYTVKIDGEESQVSLNELVNGYQRKATYTQRQQSLAEERAELEQRLSSLGPEQQALQDERKAYAEVLQQLQQQLQSSDHFAQIDWSTLERENPVEWLKLKEYERQRNNDLAIVHEEQVRMQDIVQKQTSDEMQKRLESERVLVLENIPEWQDTDVQANEQRKMVEFGKKLGFSDEELNTVYDHRALLTLYKAWKFDQLTNGKKIRAAKSKIGSVKGGNRETVRRTLSREQKARRAKLKQTGKVEDAAALFGDMLAK